jgi:hypothetical protein
MHQGQGQAADPSPVPSPLNDAGLPAPLAAKGGLVAVPTKEQFEIVRTGARESGKVHELHRMVSAMQAAAAKCDLAHEEMVRLAEFRLQLERDLGAYLVQHVHRGGDRANAPRVRLLRDGGLPEWVTRKKSASYRELALIPDDVFRNYFEEVRKRHQVPSSRGARSFACGKKPTPIRSKRDYATRGTPSASSAEPGANLLEACLRCLGTIDVLVGNVKANVNAAVRLDADQGLSKKLRGKVLIVEAVAPEVVMRSVAAQRLAGAVQEAVVVLPRDVNHAWFAALGEGPWSCCVPREPGSPIVAHIGGHGRGFALVFARLGVLLDVRSEMSGDRRS